MERIPQQDLRAHAELNAFYIFPAGAKKSLVQPLLDAPADREAHRARCSASRRSCRQRRHRRRPPPSPWASWTRCSAGARSRARRPTGCSRSRTAYVTLETEHEHHDARQGGDRLPAAGDGRLPADRQRHGGGRARHRRGDRHELETSDDEFGYRWMIVRDPDLEDLAVGDQRGHRRARGRRLQRPRAVRRLRLRGPPKQPLYFIYNYKRGAWYPFVPAPRRHSSATTSASCSSRRRSAPSCRSSPSSSAGSPSGASRSSRSLVRAGALRGVCVMSAARGERPHRGREGPARGACLRGGIGRRA